MVAAIAMPITTFVVGAIDSTAPACSHVLGVTSGSHDAAVEDVASSPIRISLQIIRAAPMTDKMLDTILAETTAIWAPYDVIVSSTLTLSRPEQRKGEHWIKLVIRNPPANHIDGRIPSGYRAPASITFIDGMPGDLIYATLETARQAVEAAPLEHFPPEIQERFAAQLLGRAIAHELGHYLLRSASHSRTGLMRASFGARDLMAPDRNAFRLEPQQVAALRRASDKAASSPCGK